MIRDAIAAFRGVAPEVGTAWLSAFENLEKAYHSDGTVLLLEFVEFWAAVQDVLSNDRSPFASKEDDLNAIDLARAILNAPDVEKATADFEAFTLDYLNGKYLNSERGEMFEALAKVDVIGPALQTSLEKLAADQDFEIAKNYFGRILGMTEGFISTASSALEVETAINSVVGDIEKMLEETKDFKEESELDLARLSRAGRESYAAFRLRRAQWPVDLKSLREDVENYKVSRRGDLLAGILKTAEDLANEIRSFWEVKDKPQSWSYWTGGRDVRAGRGELISTGKEIGRYEFLSALRHGLITQGDIVIVNVNDDAPARLRRPERFGVIEKMIAPGFIELWGVDKVNLDLGGVVIFENDPAGFALRDVISVRVVSTASSGVSLKDYLMSKLSSKTSFTVHELRSVATDRMKAVWAELNEYPDVVDTKYRAVYGGDVRGDFLGTVKVGAEEMVLTRFLGLKRNELDSESARTLVGPFYVRGNQLDKVFLNFESFEKLPDTITVAASSGLTRQVQREQMIGQALSGSEAIADAFQNRLFQVGDQVDIRFTQFDASGNPTIKAFTDAITVVNPMQVKGVVNGNTIIRVGTNGTKLENVQSITLTALANSSGAASSTAGEAKTASAPVGGIDFDPTNMNLQIKRDGKGVPLPLPQQNLEQINIEGLFPVIINIVPVNSQTLPVFLGRADSALPLGRS